MDKYSWDLSKIYKSNVEFIEDVEKVKKLADKIETIKDDFRANFKEIVIGIDEIMGLLSKLYTYSHMKQDENTKITKSQQDALLIESLEADISGKLAF